MRCEIGIRRTYSLQHIQTDDALEGEELQEDFMLAQDSFVLAVESDGAQNSNGSDDELECCDPDVREVDTVGLLAEGFCGEGDDGCEPDDQARGDEL